MSRFTVLAVLLLLPGCVAPVDEAWEETEQDTYRLVHDEEELDGVGGGSGGVAPADDMDSMSSVSWEGREELTAEEQLEPDPQPWQLEGMGSEAEPDPQPW